MRCLRCRNPTREDDPTDDVCARCHGLYRVERALAKATMRALRVAAESGSAPAARMRAEMQQRGTDPSVREGARHLVSVGMKRFGSDVWRSAAVCALAAPGPAGWHSTREGRAALDVVHRQLRAVTAIRAAYGISAPGHVRELAAALREAYAAERPIVGWLTG